MKIFEKKDFGSNRSYFYYYLFGKNIGRKNGRCYYLFGDRYIGWHDWKFYVAYHTCGYEECNGELHISILGWHSVFRMPFKDKRFPYGDCCPPVYGISVSEGSLWIHKGGNGNLGGGDRNWSYDLPFFTKVHMRHDVLCNLGTEDDNDIFLVPYRDLSNKGNDWKPLRTCDAVCRYSYNFHDSYDGSVVPCTFWVEEQEWRPKWLTWTGLFKTVNRYLEIVFDGEIGKGKDTWKGGCTGCCCPLNAGESPMDGIKRLEREEKF